MGLSEKTKTSLAFKKLLMRDHRNVANEWYEETEGGGFNIHMDDVWSENIPETPPSESTEIIEVHGDGTPFMLTEDEAVDGQKGWKAVDENGERMRDWIPPKFGQDYTVQLFADDGSGTGPGDQIFTTDPINWYFDYDTGYLSIQDSHNRSTPFWIKGYRYIGKRGMASDEPVRAIDGSAEEPAFSFFDDENTGMYREDDDYLGFSTGGELRFAIGNESLNSYRDLLPSEDDAYDIGSEDYRWKDAFFSGDMTIDGNLTVRGQENIIEVNTVRIEDKNIELAYLPDTEEHSDEYADLGGMTVKGDTDKLFKWRQDSGAWYSSEPFTAPQADASRPSYSFNDDLDTGIYNPEGDQIGLSTDGELRLLLTTEELQSYEDIVPSEHDQLDLGRDELRWRNLYLSGDQHAEGQMHIGSDLIVDGDTTLGEDETKTTSMRGKVTLEDSSEDHPLEIGPDIELFRSGMNMLNIETADETRLQISDNEITSHMDLLPDTDDSLNIGSESRRWKNGYFSGNLEVDGEIHAEGSIEFDDDLFVKGDTVLGEDETKTTTIRGETTLQDSSEGYPLKLGDDVELYREGENKLSVDTGGEQRVKVTDDGITFFEDLVPDEDTTYDAGRQDSRWNNLYADGLDLSGDAVIEGNLTVNGEMVIFDTETFQVEDKYIELGMVEEPDDFSADEGGIVLHGDTNKEFRWDRDTHAWISSESIDIPDGEEYRIGGDPLAHSDLVGHDGGRHVPDPEPADEGDLLTIEGEGYVWKEPPVSVTVKNIGELQTHDGTEPATLEAGEEGQFLTLDSSTDTGLKWIYDYEVLPYARYFDPERTYIENDVVFYNSASYVSLVDNNTDTPGMSENWEKISGWRWRGVYDSGETYRVGDAVEFQGSSYMALEEAQGVEPIDENYWVLMTYGWNWRDEYSEAASYNKGDLVIERDELIESWSEDILYNVDDEVIIEGQKYRCTEEHTSSEDTRPPSGSEWSNYWSDEGEVNDYYRLYLCQEDETSGEPLDNEDHWNLVTSIFDLANTLQNNEIIRQGNETYRKENEGTRLTDYENFKHKGEYSETEEYKPYNMVYYQGSYYMATEETQGNNPTDTDYWKPVTYGWNWRSEFDINESYNKGDIVIENDQEIDSWDESIRYVVGDQVVVEGQRFTCSQEHTSTVESRPGEGTDWSDYWSDDGPANDYYRVYVCLQDHTSGEPLDNESYWNLVSSNQSLAETLQNNEILRQVGETYRIENEEQRQDNEDDRIERHENFEHLDVYDETAEYNPYNMVYYQGSSYIAIEETQGNDPTDTGYWQLMSHGWNWRGEFDIAESYNKGDIVIENDEDIDSWIEDVSYGPGDQVVINGHMYECTELHTSSSDNKPEEGDWGSYWASGVSLNDYYRLYICREDGVSGEPLSNETYWSIVINAHNLSSTLENNESLRQSRESVRIDNENTRIDNEDQRIEDENDRLERHENFIHKGEYDETETYKPYNIVEHKGSSYKCIQEATGIGPENEDYWTLMSQKGDSGLGLTFRGEWDPSVEYFVDDAVSHQGVMYHCIEDHSDAEPPNTSYWEEIFSASQWTVYGSDSIYYDNPEGFVGIGSAPSEEYMLEVDGEIMAERVRSSEETTDEDDDDVVTTKGYIDHRFDTLVASRWEKTGDDIYYLGGNVGIQQQPSGDYEFEVDGEIMAEKVWNAVYNDLAEFMPAGEKGLEPGDVLVQTESGLTKTAEEKDGRVVGVYSDTYGFVLGGDKEDAENEDKVPVGIAGKVKVKVKEPVQIGDLLVSSDSPGYAKPIKSKEWVPGTVIGKAVESSDKESRVWAMIMLA